MRPGDASLRSTPYEVWGVAQARCHARGWTDGLPVIPATPERVPGAA